LRQYPSIYLKGLRKITTKLGIEDLWAQIYLWELLNTKQERGRDVSVKLNLVRISSIILSIIFATLVVFVCLPVAPESPLAEVSSTICCIL
jgi:hypothetical protein